MAIFSYLQRTQLLLNDTTQAKFNTEDLTTYINLGRNQIAGEGLCVRNFSTLAVTSASQQYSFSLISGLATGISQVLHVRQVNYSIANGAIPLHVRSFPYFMQYFLGQAIPVVEPPTAWAQYGQGTNGTIFVNQLDGAYTLNLDCVCLPNALSDATDTDAEVIPYPWTEAIPFYACYYALMSIGDKDSASEKLQQYEAYMQRARTISNPDVVPQAFSQHKDMMLQSRLGLTSKGNG